ncbi:peptidase [Calothrix parasitica NIES-267]|uniref:Peptidase n=1 Tax=Calothrix parasitica NIES-267 TaxID=1973488 RepID=A0A1Z4LKC7_9CYAN|nr:peptidase [Calothrix parasitica NIES-267]
MSSKKLKLHRYIGIIVGLFIAIIAFTGSILVFTEEINSFFNPQIHQIVPESKSISIEQIADIVNQNYPEEKLNYIKIPLSSQDAYQVVVKANEAKKNIYINPYGGEILATIDSNHFLKIIQQIHTNLLAGDFGEFFVGICGILLITRAINGLTLWSGWKRLSTGLTIRFKARNKHLVNYDFHQLIGFISVIFLIFAGITGTMMVFKKPIVTLGYTVSGIPQPTKVLSTPQSTNNKLTLDDFVEQANLALPDGKPTIIIPPSTDKAPVVVRKRLAKDLNKNGKSYIYLDQYSGEVLRIKNILNSPWIDKLLAMLYPLHIGSYGNNVLRFVYLIMGLVPAILFVTGLAIFWNKTYGARFRKKYK